MTKVIPLTQGKVAIIDDEDYELVSGYKWYAAWHRNNFYAQTNIATRNRPLGMHRLILGLTDPNVMCDHIDMDTLNNKRSNLRSCSRGENKRNGRKYKNNRSGYKGVYLVPRSGRFAAVIYLNGYRKHLGYFETAEKAHAAYAAAAPIFHGEFYRVA